MLTNLCIRFNDTFGQPHIQRTLPFYIYVFHYYSDMIYSTYNILIICSAIFLLINVW